MTNERTILCGELGSGARRSRATDALRLRMSGPHHNVHLSIEDISRSLAQDIPDQWIDLVEIATYVYVADQAITRGGDGVESAGANWRRRLLFEIPVRCPDLWNSARVLETLRDTLSFLSEDEYHFGFHPMQKVVTAERYLKFSAAVADGAPQQVILFSGGLDSLGGTIQEVVTGGQRAILVRHRPTSKLESRHRLLKQMLAERAGSQPPFHVTVDVNKAKDLNHEYTQRTRSFLYACLASTIARMCGLSAIRFFENGIVSFNLPISHQVVGARATRTTHPRVLRGFQDLFTQVAQQPFAVDNGFLWKTKADVLKIIADAGCGNMIEWAQSCSHIWEWTKEHPHCGMCSQCIDRRFAVLAAGLASYDPADRYGVDLLVGAREEGEPRVMVTSYVDTALRATQMSALEFFSQYGEVSRILSYLDGAREDNAHRIYKLYRRHGETVAKVIDDGIAQYRSQIRSRELPTSCLLRLVHDPSVPGDGSSPGEPARAKPTQTVEVKHADNVFKRRGQAWICRFRGKDDMIVLPSRGAAYLHILLSAPGKQFSAADLLIQVAKAPGRYPLSDAGESIDKEARAAYRARYVELQDELDAAKAAGNDKAIDQITADMRLLVKELKRVGLSGQPRREKATRNRVRNSVSNAIARAIEGIKPFDAELHEHLKKHIKKGFNPQYDPPDGFTWET